MSSGRLQIQSIPRGAHVPGTDPTAPLVAHLERLVAAGRAWPRGVVVRPGAFELVDLRPDALAGMPVPWLLAGLTSTVTQAGPVEAVGVLGVVQRRIGEASAPVAMVFLEWEDNRWWQHTRVLAEGGRALRDDTVLVRCALDGDALPAGLGRWWSVARRSGVRMRLAPTVPPEDTVH